MLYFILPYYILLFISKNLLQCLYTYILHLLLSRDWGEGFINRHYTSIRMYCSWQFQAEVTHKIMKLKFSHFPMLRQINAILWLQFYQVSESCIWTPGRILRTSYRPVARPLTGQDNIHKNAYTHYWSAIWLQDPNAPKTAVSICLAQPSQCHGLITD
jgi:hypothetical protein